jgi:hypothetical protein
LLEEEIFSEKKCCIENQNTRFSFSKIFHENYAVYENLEKYGTARRAAADSVVMAHALWVLGN